jgi:hypothetical protein
VYLSPRNVSLPEGRAHKLLPRYIEPYWVTSIYPEKSNYTLDLSPELIRRHIYMTFHVSLLRPYHPNDDQHFPKRKIISLGLVLGITKILYFWGHKYLQNFYFCLHFASNKIIPE